MLFISFCIFVDRLLTRKNVINLIIRLFLWCLSVSCGRNSIATDWTSTTPWVFLHSRFLSLLKRSLTPEDSYE